MENAGRNRGVACVFSRILLIQIRSRNAPGSVVSKLKIKSC